MCFGINLNLPSLKAAISFLIFHMKQIWKHPSCKHEDEDKVWAFLNMFLHNIKLKHILYACFGWLACIILALFPPCLDFWQLNTISVTEHTDETCTVMDDVSTWPWRGHQSHTFSSCLHTFSWLHVHQWYQTYFLPSVRLSLCRSRDCL